MAEGLHRIGVEQNPVLLRDGSDLLYRLDGADLVVGKHHGYQDGVGTDGLPELIQLHRAELIHVQIGDLKSVLFQVFAGVQDRVVLDLRGDDVLSLRLVRLGGGLQRPVVGLASSSCEIYLLRLRSQRARDGLPGRRDGLLRRGCKFVDGGRVAVELREIRDHGLHHLRANSGSRRIVQINRLFHVKSAFLVLVVFCRTKVKSFIYDYYYIVYSPKLK